MVNYHLLVKWFMRNYEECWWAHGQKRDGSFTSNYLGSSSTYHMDEIVHDIARQDFDWEQDREQPMNSDAKAFTNHECFESLLKAIKSMLPDNEKLPDHYYSCKKMLKKLGLGYQKIDVCPNDYRLKRLYMSSRTNEHMSWHAKYPAKDGELNHPADGQAWKDFNKAHPRFASEPRNVRLGLSTNGFNPFGHSAVPYSCWPVIVTPYNLPPWMCMKQPYMFLSLMIPGPTSPGKNLDVYLRPLIDELKVLWKDGIQTWDVLTQTNFNLRAALMWTISDFPAYGMLTGWSTHGKVACPYCMEHTKSFTLQKGAEMRTRVMRLPIVPFGKNDKKISGFGESHNWVRKRKTKDNDKARLDLKDICKRPALELRQSSNDYFPDEVLTKANHVSRNDDGGNIELNGRLSIFGLSGRANNLSLI
ncbi:hypothetical protein AgCh_012013 [Apium graveolens]